MRDTSINMSDEQKQVGYVRPGFEVYDLNRVAAVYCCMDGMCSTLPCSGGVIGEFPACSQCPS